MPVGVVLLTILAMSPQVKFSDRTAACSATNSAIAPLRPVHGVTSYRDCSRTIVSTQEAATLSTDPTRERTAKWAACGPHAAGGTVE